jgi:hypothetical protein
MVTSKNRCTQCLDVRSGNANLDTVGQFDFSLRQPTDVHWQETFCNSSIFRFPGSTLNTSCPSVMLLQSPTPSIESRSRYTLPAAELGDLQIAVTKSSQPFTPNGLRPKNSLTFHRVLLGKGNNSIPLQGTLDVNNGSAERLRYQ